MRRLKVKVVGDGNVGKTSFLVRWYHENFPDQDETPLFPGREKILPSVQDPFFTNMTVDRANYVLTFWDTISGAEFLKFRPMEYEETDVFLVFFDLSNPTSFQNVSTVWVPELKHYMPGTPILVVGNKTDLRKSRWGWNFFTYFFLNASKLRAGNEPFSFQFRCSCSNIRCNRYLLFPSNNDSLLIFFLNLVKLLQVTV